MRLLKQIFITNFLIYSFCYLAKTWVIWEFTNPFRWVLDIPVYSNEDRGLILAFYFMYLIIHVVVFVVHTDTKK
jgi:hypothetical protein